ncbi:MAG: phosphoglycerate mutase family protein [Melioribacteraceae bacterium]
MQFGLVRHFKVITNEKIFLNSNEFVEAMRKYDFANVSKNGLKINSNDWDVCYCSTLPRAITTAEEIFFGKIIKTDLLREVPISPFTKRNFKLPVFIWQIGARIAWYKSHKSQTEDVYQTKKRINEFYELIKNSGYEKILIVSHGYFLQMFSQEMFKNGFKGKIDLNIKNAQLYLLEK